MSTGNLQGLCLVCLGKVILQNTSASAEKLDPGGDDDTGPPQCGNRFGDYELLEQVGSGGMGVVFRARQVSLNRVVALKMILAPKLHDAASVGRFRTEAEAAARLQHPHIVAIHDFGEVDGQSYYAMDFVGGESLAQRVRKSPLSLEQAARYVQTVAEAIHYAHQRGILHRDLKPSNVLIDAQDRVCVTDFGLAKMMQGDTDLTLTGQVMGSPSYMAPEQAEGRSHNVSVRSDVYALGAMLYELVTGTPPFKADTALATLKQVVEDLPTPPRARNVNVSPDLETICLKCLEKDPARRYGSAQELADELGRFLRNEPIAARPIRVPERLWRWSRRKPTLAGALAAVLVALTVGVAGIAWQWRQTEGHRRRAETEERSARHHLYAADMYAAYQAFQGENWGLVRRLLAAHRPAPGQEDLREFAWRHLWHQVEGDQLGVLQGHSNVVTALAFSPDSRRLVSAGREGCLRVWDVEHRVLQAVLPGMPGHVYRIAFSSDGKQLAVGAGGGVELRNTETWEVVARIAAPSSSVAFAPSNSLLAIGQGNAAWGLAQTGPTWLWDLERGALALCFTNGGGRVAFSPDGHTLATGNRDDEVKFWEVPSGRYCGAISPGLRLLGLDYSPDGRFLGTVQWHDGPRLGTASGSAPLEHLGGDHLRVRTLAFSPDSRLMATAGANQTVDLWETETRQLRTRLHGHGEEIWALAFSPDGKLLASGGRDELIFLWDPYRTAPPEGVQGLLGVLGSPSFVLSAHHTHVAAATRNGVEVWTIGALQKPWLALSAEVPLGFTNNLLATLRRPAKLQAWDIARQQVVSEVDLPVPFNRINDCRLSPSGRWIAWGASGQLHLADARTGRLTASPKRHLGYVHALDYTRDERRLVSADQSGRAYLWDIPTLEPRGSFCGHTDYVRGLAVSPDGTQVATASADTTARVWSLADCRELAILRGHNEEINDVAYAPDGRTLATSSYDRTVRLWDVRTYREIAVLCMDGVRVRNLPAHREMTHDNGFLRLGFSGDGRLLAAEDLWGKLYFWHAPEAEEIRP